MLFGINMDQEMNNEQQIATELDGSGVATAVQAPDFSWIDQIVGEDGFEAHG